jgi:hypothetical protein
MSSDPAVLFYTSDFISGTLLFSYEQKGQYISLLCLQHQIYPDHIPENHMISVCLSYDSPVIKKFVKDEFGKYYNERMLFEIEKRINFCNSRSNNKSGRKSKKSYENHMNNHMLQHMENENENENRIEDAIENKTLRFKTELNSHTEYPEQMRIAFFDYWTEPNKSKTKLRFELEKTWDTKRRLNTWASRDKSFTTKKFGRQEISMEELRAQAERVILS